MIPAPTANLNLGFNLARYFNFVRYFHFARYFHATRDSITGHRQIQVRAASAMRAQAARKMASSAPSLRGGHGSGWPSGTTRIHCPARASDGTRGESASESKTTAFGL